MHEQDAKKRGPLVTKIVEGVPIRVEGREVVPVVRMTSRVQRRAFVCNDRIGARGGGSVHMRPVAILERDETGERRIPIQDKTMQALGGLLLAAFVIPPLLALAVRLMRKTSSQQSAVSG